MKVVSPDDRRIEPRLRLGLHVVEVDGEDKYFQYATNLSAGGIFLSGTLPNPPGTNVTLVFKLPGEANPLAIPAVVVGNSDGNARGTHFRFVDDESSDARGQIRKFVEQRQRRFAAV